MSDNVTRIVVGKELKDVLLKLFENQSTWTVESSTRRYVISYDEKNRELGFHMSWKLKVPLGFVGRLPPTQHVDKQFSTLEEAVAWANENVEGPWGDAG